jgi:hypothetical protein
MSSVRDYTLKSFKLQVSGCIVLTLPEIRYTMAVMLAMTPRRSRIVRPTVTMRPTS